MAVGGAAGIGFFLVRPLALLIFKTPGDSGIAYFVIGVYLVMAASIGWKGCLAFEISRWIGGAPQGAPRRMPFRWRQDAVVAALLVAVFIGVPYGRRAFAPEPCGQKRIACVATLKSDIRRMISVPLGTPGRLESTINSVRMQIRSGSGVRWEAVESPSASLRAAGYPPATDSSVPVLVKVDASESGAGVVLTIAVSDAGEETARFAVTFPRGSRLDRDSKGKLNLLAELPRTSDSMIKGSWPDDEHGRSTLDQLFVFFRQAIGTELEAREHSLKIVGTPILTAHADHVDGSCSVDEMRLGSDLAKQCADRVARTQGGKVRSYADTDLGWELMSVAFTQALTAPPQTYAHTTDRMVCSDATTWIVHHVPLESVVVLRRYAADGTLQRFVESPLPAIATEESFAFVDAASVRETGDAIWFDRIEARRGKKIGSFEVIGRDTFRIPLIH